ncbi:MAG: type IV conjugative transfer system lipoprotein TraV [Nitrospirota bacterium]
MRFAAACVSILAAAVLAGCAARYSCPAPKGVSCKPISEVYRSTLGSATTPKVAKNATAPSTPAKPAAPPSLAEGQPPIRSAPKILRVWIAPWIDDEGDLHQEGYVYVVVDHGAWTFGVPATTQEAGSRDEAK